MSQIMNWCSMGGYGFYVWPAYGFAVMVLSLLAISAKKQKKQIDSRLRQWFNLENAIEPTTSAYEHIKHSRYGSTAFSRFKNLILS